MYGQDREQAPGVYAVGEDGDRMLVHGYLDDSYALEDIVENFGLGRLDRSASDDGPELVLSDKDVRELRVNADAYSFDYEEGFIEMCLDIDRFAAASADAGGLRLVSVD